MNKITVLFFLMVTVCVFSCKKDYNAAPQNEVSQKQISDRPKWDGVIATFDSDDQAGKSGFAVKQKIKTAMEKHGAKAFHVLNVAYANVPSAIETLKKNPHVKSVSPNYICYYEPDFVTNASRTLRTKKSGASIGHLFDPPTNKENIFNIRQVALLVEPFKITFGKKAISNNQVSRYASITETYPNDSLYSQQWGLQSIKAPTAWVTNKGSQKIYVGDIDEGCDYTHVDMYSQVDCRHSYDFYNHDPEVNDWQDVHGISTGSEIGANVNNFFGMAGACPNVTIIQGKFLQGGSGSTAAGIEAIDYITHLKVDSGFNFVCTNNSWGYSGTEIPELHDAIQRAQAAGIIFNAAAGNDGRNTDGDDFYPADFADKRSPYYLDNVQSVGALASNEMSASFSNYGVNSVSIYAPGVGITCATYDQSLNDAWWQPSGTSMATPFVSAACALYASGHQTATYRQIIDAIEASGRSLTSLADKCRTGKTLDVSSFTQGNNDPVLYPRFNCQRPAVDTATPTQVVCHVVSVTDHDQTIAWTTSQHAYYYGILIRRTGIPDGQYSTFNTQQTFNGFPTGDTVTYFIFPISKINKYGPTSDPCQAITTGPHDFTPPTAPTNFTAQNLIQDTLTKKWSADLTWTPSTDNDWVLGHYGFGSNVKPYPNNASYQFYVWRTNAGVLVTTLSLAGIPDNDTLNNSVQGIDASGNRSGFAALRITTTGGTVNPPPPPPPIDPPVVNSFTSDPTMIDSGQTSTLFWNVTGATSVTIDGQAASGTSLVVAPTSTHTYALVAINDGGTASASTTITVMKPPPPIDTTISISGANKIIHITRVPSGTVEIQKSNKQGGIFSTIATTDKDTYFIGIKPKRWYRAKFGTKISNQIQL